MLSPGRLVVTWKHATQYWIYLVNIKDNYNNYWIYQCDKCGLALTLPPLRSRYKKRDKWTNSTFKMTRPTKHLDTGRIISKENVQNIISYSGSQVLCKSLFFFRKYSNFWKLLSFLPIWSVLFWKMRKNKKTSLLLFLLGIQTGDTSVQWYPVSTRRSRSGWSKNICWNETYKNIGFTCSRILQPYHRIFSQTGLFLPYNKDNICFCL